MINKQYEFNFLKSNNEIKTVTINVPINQPTAQEVLVSEGWANRVTIPDGVLGTGTIDLNTMLGTSTNSITGTKTYYYSTSGTLDLSEYYIDDIQPTSITSSSYLTFKTINHKTKTVDYSYYKVTFPTYTHEGQVILPPLREQVTENYTVYYKASGYPTMQRCLNKLFEKNSKNKS